MTVRTTRHGIPHVVAGDWASLGYGSGYATASSSICNLADTLLTARGQRSRYLGPDERYDDQVSLDASNLEVDAFVTDLHNRHVVEGLLASQAGPSARAKAMVEGYVAGINRWLRDNTITDPACAGQAWITPTATALDLWCGVYMANMLASSGVFLADIVEADAPNGLGRDRWFTGLTERRIWLNEGREFDLAGRQVTDKRVNTMIIGYAEIDGVEARVLPDDLEKLAAQLTRTVRFTEIKPVAAPANLSAALR